MSPLRTCCNCYAWKRIDGSLGECHFHAPSSNVDAEKFVVWPGTLDCDQCMQHRPIPRFIKNGGKPGRPVGKSVGIILGLVRQLPPEGATAAVILERGRTIIPDLGEANLYRILRQLRDGGEVAQNSGDGAALWRAVTQQENAAASAGATSAMEVE